MPTITGLTAAQQAKIDVAQKRLDTAKSNYQGYITSYNNYGAGITPCYAKNKTWYDGSQATWFNPNRDNCTTQGKCKPSDKNNCQALVDTLNTTIIPALRAAYAEINSAQSNFDKVLSEVEKEVSADPAVKAKIEAAKAAAIAQAEALKAQAEAEKEAAKYRYIFYGILAVTILGIIYVIFRFRKKAA